MEKVHTCIWRTCIREDAFFRAQCSKDSIDGCRFQEEPSPTCPHHPVRLPSRHCGVLPLPGDHHYPGPQVGAKQQKMYFLQQLKNFNLRQSWYHSLLRRWLAAICHPSRTCTTSLPPRTLPSGKRLDYCLAHCTYSLYFILWTFAHSLVNIFLEMFFRILLSIFYFLFLVFTFYFLRFFTYYVCCYAPKRQDKFFLYENLLGNKHESDSVSASLQCSH